MGADSRLFSRDSKITRTACKIGISNDVAWIDPGILLEVGDRGFSINDITTKIMASTSSVEQKIAALKDKIGPIYIELLTDSRTNRHLADLYRHFVLEKNSTLEMAFAYYVGEAPRLTLINLTASVDATGAISLDFKRKDSPEFDLVTLGQHVAVDEEVRKSRAIFSIMGVPAAIGYLIRKQILATPETVGPPIAILRLDHTGPQWISKGVCSP